MPRHLPPRAGRAAPLSFGPALAAAAILSAAPGCDRHEYVCEAVDEQVGLHDGFDVPGVAGAPRWGIPDAPPATLKVRRSWSSLTDAEKKAVVDAFVALKHVTVNSGDAGSPRADYNSLCEATGQPGYDKNLYDYYAEAHANAFVSMMTGYQSHSNMAHMGPQFLVWHRYVLLRMEADLAEVTGDPNFTIPYWDWTDCYEDGDPDTCAPMFEPGFMGDGGSCDEDDNAVGGYLIDQGFTLNLYTNDESAFSPDSIVCGQRPLRRAVGCSKYVDGPPDQAAIDGIFERTSYDSAPYDACSTDEATSFRQYLEGFSSRSKKFVCTAKGCEMHGRGHFYVGGDMYDSSASPNDPMFFLHHAQVDRLWAAWQEANLRSSDEARHANSGNPGYPDSFDTGLFVFHDVRASELFDYRALGYEYDSLPEPR